VNVQELDAVADRQYRLAAYKSVIEQPVIGMLSPFVGFLVSWMCHTAKTPRFHVGGTPGQYEPIDRLRRSFQFSWREEK
jgi:hypothetical protein